MNPNLARLQAYPFEKLRALYSEVAPNASYAPINLSIGEPRHPTPEFIKRALCDSLAGLASYPATAGTESLRAAIAAWLCRRYRLKNVDPERQVLPVNGSREALFAIAQAVVDSGRESPLVVSPNPFYQIYEGAALLAGATPHFVNAPASRGFAPDYASVPEGTWRTVQLLYVCSPANPTGRVTTVEEWKTLFELSERHGFVIASDECYSELYFDESRPPLGALEAAQRLGRDDFARLVVFSSLSKRSNVPGMRSGFVAGDRSLLKQFLLYRTYHGGAMNPAVQAASVAAWNDEEHVRENRRLYAQKFREALLLVREPFGAAMPEAGFYFWLKAPAADTVFARDLYRAYNVAVLPGSFLAREANGENPGSGYVRIALVASREECLEAIRRIVEFSNSNGRNK